MLEKVDTFVVYLGTDAMYGKIDVRFVISDPENLLEHFFTKKKFFKKNRNIYDSSTGWVYYFGYTTDSVFYLKFKFFN